MPVLLPLSILFLLGQTPAPEPAHAGNPTFADLIGRGVELGPTTVRFDPPALRDDQDADAQRAALRAVAGSDANAAELLRDSVTAPFVLKVRELVTEGDTLVRAADLWFVVRADFDQLDPDQVRLGAGEPVEVANMRFTVGEPDQDSLRKAGVEPGGRGTRFVHVDGRLLDRIGVGATDRIVTTRSGGSLVVASRTDPAFGADGPLGNRWWPIVRKSGRDEAGAARPYAGAVGYVKVSRYLPEPGVLVVEAHVAFAEPRAWFDGAPILRSKIGLAAQDQIRRLRRELQKKQD